MAYDKKLRPRKHLLKCFFKGKFGKFDFTDSPILWGNMTDEMLVTFHELHDAKTVQSHLTGELPAAKAVSKKMSAKPSTDEPKEQK